MSKVRNAVTKVPFQSKVPGQPRIYDHRSGIKCRVERNKSNPGQFIVWFGAGRYATVDARDLDDKLFFLD